MAFMSSKLFCMRKRNTAKNTSRNTTSFTPGRLWEPSMRCEIWMSFMVKTSESTPHPMGSIATCQTERAMSPIDTLPAEPSMPSKSAPSIPEHPMDFSTSTWAEKIQLQQSRSIPQSHPLMSSAMEAYALWHGTSVRARRHTVMPIASEKRLSDMTVRTMFIADVIAHRAFRLRPCARTRWSMRHHRA